jgi:hypothetical protein
MRSLWEAHYPRCPWWARWFTWHWWKAKIWEANHPNFHPGCVPEETWTRPSYTGPLSPGAGAVCRIDTRSTEQMFKDLEKSCPTLFKNDGNN